MLEKCFRVDSFLHTHQKNQVLSSAIDVGFIGTSVKCWFTFRICIFLIFLCGAEHSEIDLLYLSNSSLNSLLYQIIWNEMHTIDFWQKRRAETIVRLYAEFY